VLEGDAAHQAASGPSTPVAFDFGASPISKNLQRKYVFFVQPTSITGDASNGFSSVDVVTTTNQAYQIAQPRNSAARTANDKGGPFVLMRTLQQTKGSGAKGRVVLVGTSAIAENQALPPNASGANPDLFLGTLDWLSQQEDLIGVSPDELQAEVARASSEADVAQWLREHADVSEYAAANEYFTNRSVHDIKPENQERFQKNYPHQHDAPSDKMIDIVAHDDAVSFAATSG